MAFCHRSGATPLSFGWLFNLVVTPALVSLGVSVWVGRLIEERRARRDHITKLFESAREEVRRSVDAAIDCFSTKPVERKPIQESKVIASDKELRSALPLLLTKARTSGCIEETEKTRDAFENFIVELTGGNFQSKTGRIQRDHITRIVHTGASLRVGLARLRDAELKARTDADPIFRRGRYAWLWLTRPSELFSVTDNTSRNK